MPRESAVREGGEYGLLYVVGLRHEVRGGRSRLVANCQCRCGRLWSGLAQDLLAGKTTSCGCGGTAVERLTRRRNAEPIPELADGTVFIGELLVAEAWRNTARTGRECVWVLLRCPWCSRHLVWTLDDAERRKAKSCGCLGRPKYVTIEEQEERRKQIRQPDWDLTPRPNRRANTPLAE